MRKVSLITLAFLAAATSATAQTYDSLASVDVLPGWRQANGDHIAALQITLQPGWLTYWRAPGDSGIPPTLEITGGTGIAALQPVWPTPEVIVDKGVRSIGYYDSVVVPLLISPTQSGPLQLSGTLDIGVCEEVCIPVSLRFDATLPHGASPDPAIAEALAQGPLTAQEGQVGDVSCTLSPISDGLRLTTDIPVASVAAEEHVVIETADPSVWVSEAEVTRTGDALRASVDLVHPSGGAFALDRSALRMTVLGGPRAIDIQGCDAG